MKRKLSGLVKFAQEARNFSAIPGLSKNQIDVLHSAHPDTVSYRTPSWYENIPFSDVLYATNEAIKSPTRLGVHSAPYVNSFGTGLTNIGYGLAAIPYIGGKWLYDNRYPLLDTAFAIKNPGTMPQSVKEDVLENIKRIGARGVAGIYQGANNIAKYTDLAAHAFWNPRILWDKNQTVNGKTRNDIIGPYKRGSKIADEFATMFDKPYNEPTLEHGANAAGVNAGALGFSGIPFAAAGDAVTKLSPAVNVPNTKLGKLFLNGFTGNGGTSGGVVTGPILKDQLIRLAEGYSGDDYAPTDVGSAQGDTAHRRSGLPIRQVLNMSPLGVPYRIATALEDYENGDPIGTKDYAGGLGDNDNYAGNLAFSLNKNILTDIFDAYKSSEKSSPKYKYIDPVMALQSDIGSLLPGKWGSLGRLIGGIGEFAWPMYFKQKLMEKDLLKEQKQNEQNGQKQDSLDQIISDYPYWNWSHNYRMAEKNPRIATEYTNYQVTPGRRNWLESVDVPK